VVVAAGAAQRDAEEVLAEHVELLVDNVELAFLRVAVGGDDVEQGQVAGGDKVGGALLGRAGRQQVAGQLLPHKLVERPVAVEGVDDVLAVPPRFRIGRRRRRPAHVGVAGQVEPVPAPALAEVPRAEQVIHHPGQPLRRWVGQRPGQLLGRRRQAGEDVVDAAEQDMPFGVGGGFQPLRLQPGQDEAVDVAARPGNVPDGGGRRPSEGPQRPQPLPLLLRRFPGRLHRLRPRIGRTDLHPVDEVGNDLIGQLPRGGHLQVLVLEGLDEQALSRTARYQGRPAAAPPAQAVAAIQTQVSLHPSRLGRVAGVAVLDQHRPNLRLEEVDAARVVRCRGQTRRRQRQDRPQHERSSSHRQPPDRTSAPSA
jgi:hypothetical protein